MAELDKEISIADRLTHLEDVERIRALKARCCLLVDKMDRDGFAALFTEDGVFEGAFQRLEGLEALRRVEFWPFMVHFVSNPIIDVTGSKATGRWYFLRAYNTPEGRPHWAAGIYDDDYVKLADGGWKFRSVKITNFFACPYETGWVANAS